MSTNVKQTVNFKINGKDASATEDTVIIEAAKQHGIEITNLCYNRKLKPFAACRTCMVDMRTPEGKKELVYSCTQPVAEGIEVFTDTVSSFFSPCRVGNELKLSSSSSFSGL